MAWRAHAEGNASSPSVASRACLFRGPTRVLPPSRATNPRQSESHEDDQSDKKFQFSSTAASRIKDEPACISGGEAPPSPQVASERLPPQPV
jgi:hypothetical protein